MKHCNMCHAALFVLMLSACAEFDLHSACRFVPQIPKLMMTQGGNLGRTPKQSKMHGGHKPNTKNTAHKVNRAGPLFTCVFHKSAKHHDLLWFSSQNPMTIVEGEKGVKHFFAKVLQSMCADAQARQVEHRQAANRLTTCMLPASSALDIEPLLEIKPCLVCCCFESVLLLPFVVSSLPFRPA